MVDLEIIRAKASTVRKHLRRIALKTPDQLEIFIRDVDQQDIILFNIQMAIQNCIDMAAHIISDQG
ncbi:MAG: hypothetical protein M0036_17035 [Desulfobacteraceae bacterium]|nr:hypothetical protein [Desulfobacteraceae bacterium]